MALPLPKVVPDTQPGGNLITAMSGMNALTQSNLENQIKRVQAQYAPYTTYADAASKLAYAQFVGPQAIANILSNPASRGMFTPEQYNQLVNAFSSQVKNPGMTMANLPVPQQEVSPFKKLLNFLTGTQPSTQTSNPFSTQQIQGNVSQQQQPNALSQSVPFQSQQIISNPLAGTSPTYERASSQLTPGTYGAASPSAITQAGEAGLKAQTEAEAKAITDQWQKRQDDILDQASGSIEMENQLDRLSQLRGELSKAEKGFPLGYFPGISSAAQESGLVENNLIAARLKAWQSSRITNMDIGFGKGMKPGRWMNDESFQNEVNYERALAKRLQENSVFLNSAQKLGLSPSQADSIWIRYANEKPFFNPKTKQPIDENFDTWEQYLTPDSLKQTFSPSYRKQMNEYRNNMSGFNPKEDKKIQQKYNDFPNKTRGAHILSKSMNLPDFKNKEDFLNWYNKQDEFVKHAVRIRLGEKE